MIRMPNLTKGTHQFITINTGTFMYREHILTLKLTVIHEQQIEFDQKEEMTYLDGVIHNHCGIAPLAPVRERVNHAEVFAASTAIRVNARIIRRHDFATTVPDNRRLSMQKGKTCNNNWGIQVQVQTKTS